MYCIACLLLETSDITSVCSLSASAGAEAEYINLQNQQAIDT